MITPLYTYEEIRLNIIRLFKNESELIYIKEWQGRENHTPMRVIRNLNFKMKIPGGVKNLTYLLEPDLPWAEDHFKERVSGVPMNPAPSFQWWPYYKQGNKWEINDSKQFSHTYPERMWINKLEGKRYPYGNLGDVLDLLASNQQTRQAYLPIWFPEDTGAVHGERVPCTIGYLFTIKEEANGVFKTIDIHYQMRSCDFMRHFHNDMYLTARLLQWVCEELTQRDDKFIFLPGEMIVTIANLHIFDGEEAFLKLERGN